jgi:hypothetical protein
MPNPQTNLVRMLVRWPKSTAGAGSRTLILWPYPQLCTPWTQAFSYLRLRRHQSKALTRRGDQDEKVHLSDVRIC